MSIIFVHRQDGALGSPIAGRSPERLECTANRQLGRWLSPPALRIACFRCYEGYLIFGRRAGQRSAPTGTEHIFCSFFTGSSLVVHGDVSTYSIHHATIKASWQARAN